MIEAVKYIDPTWYFNILTKDESRSGLLDYRELDIQDKSLIDYDPNYEKLSLADASFQALKKGIISSKTIPLNKSNFQDIPVSDQYRFLRKYYHLGWSVYFLMNRILQFHNPVKEVKCLFKSLKVKRYSLYNKVATHELDKLDIKDNYKVSIILPTLNRYEHLINILNDVSIQSTLPLEIIIIDQSSPRNEGFYRSFQHLPLRVIYQEERGQWYARNEAIKNSSGDYILLVDDDSRVNEDWIEQHLKCVLFFGCDISAGVSFEEGEKIITSKTIYHLAEEFDSGNALVRRTVFEKVGLFDESFNGIRMGDTEFGLRAYSNGFKSVSNPNASRMHIHTDTGGMRDWASFNAFKPMNFFGPRPNRGTLYLYIRNFNKKYLLSFLIIRIYHSYVPLKNKNLWLGKLSGLGLFLLFFPYWAFDLLFKLLRVRKYAPSIPTIPRYEVLIGKENGIPLQ